MRIKVNVLWVPYSAVCHSQLVSVHMDGFPAELKISIALL